ncbi:MAG: DUF4198 domain-containing protein [Gemmatimonadota bacterium]|nr:DUF4198 domain-containing protein [Gemmatimonadota bacterium]
MKRRWFLVSIVLLATASALSAHDLFLRLDGYFLATDQAVEVLVLNGSFSASEGAVTGDRLLDASLVSPRGRNRLPGDQWVPRGDTTYVRFTTGDAGTYVLGASTKPRDIALSATDFNEYLAHDGIPDVLAARERDGELDDPARELYAKHVKAVFQVGSQQSDHYSTVLGYPAEIVAVDNPYAVPLGGELRFRCFVDGKPVANQLVIAGGEAEGVAFEERAARSDANGVVRFAVDRAGQWYVKFINMVKVDEPDLDYVSKWATLTFEVR